jgi:hypothetical protein
VRSKVAAHNEIYKLSPCGIPIRGHTEAGESKTLSPRLPISEWARENFEEQYLGRERKNADAARIKVAAGAQTQTQFRGWPLKRRGTAQTGVKLFSSNFIV